MKTLIFALSLLASFSVNAQTKKLFFNRTVECSYHGSTKTQRTEGFHAVCTAQDQLMSFGDAFPGNDSSFMVYNYGKDGVAYKVSGVPDSLSIFVQPDGDVYAGICGNLLQSAASAPADENNSFGGQQIKKDTVWLQQQSVAVPTYLTVDQFVQPAPGGKLVLVEVITDRHYYDRGIFAYTTKSKERVTMTMSWEEYKLLKDTEKKYSQTPDWEPPIGIVQVLTQFGLFNRPVQDANRFKDTYRYRLIGQV